MKKLFLFLAMISLVLGFCGGVIGDTSSNVVTLDVNTVIDITVSPVNTAFSTVNPGTISTLGNAGSPAITVTANDANSDPIDISISGTDFTSGANNFLITYATCHGEGLNLPVTFPTTPVSAVVFSSVEHGISKGMWFTLDVPANQHSGRYTSTFTISSSKSA